MFYVKLKIKSSNINNITIITLHNSQKCWELKNANGFWNEKKSVFAMNFFIKFTQLCEKIVIIQYMENNLICYKKIVITNMNYKNTFDLNLNDCEDLYINFDHFSHFKYLFDI